MDTQAVHIWGFYDAEGNLEFPNGCAAEFVTPFEMWRSVVSNITHNGGSVDNTKTTRMEKGLIVGVTFNSTMSRGPFDMVPETMWHVIKVPDSPWPRKD